MEFKSPPSSEIYYRTRVLFADNGTRRWALIVKDWTGKVILQQEGQAVRHAK
jgi:hypothetical protein